MSPAILILLFISVLVLSVGAVLVISVANSFVSDIAIRDRLDNFAKVHETAPARSTSRRRTRFLRWRMRINAALSMFASDELTLKLASANWQITETEFILIRLLSTFFGFGAGYLLFRSIYSGLGFALLFFLIPAIHLQWSIFNRRARFEKQLIDILVLIKGAVLTGYSFLQALDIVIDEMQAPATDEFRRVRREVSLGLPLGQALANLSSRMQSDDLHLVITAVNINSQVGGNLSTMLEAVTETIRERVRLFSEIRALSAQQRFSGYVLTLLPFIVAAILFILNPEYISRIFEPGPILCIPIGALILILIGNVIIRLMGRIDV